MLVYYLYAKIGVCGLRIYCVLCFTVMTTGHSFTYYILGFGVCGLRIYRELCFMVMTTGRSFTYYVLGLFGFCMGLWHDFSILSQLVWLERVRDRT